MARKTTDKKKKKTREKNQLQEALLEFRKNTRKGSWGPKKRLGILERNGKGNS